MRFAEDGPVLKANATLNAWVLIVACILACFCLALSIHVPD